MISCLGPAAWARPRCLEYYAVMHWRAVHICHWPKYMKAQLLHFLAIDSRDSRIIILFITSRKSGKAFCYAREHNCCNASSTIQKARPSKKKKLLCGRNFFEKSSFMGRKSAYTCDFFHYTTAKCLNLRTFLMASRTYALCIWKAFLQPSLKIKKKSYFLRIPWAIQKQNIWRWFWFWAVWSDPWVWRKATSLKARSIAPDKFLLCHSLLENIFGSFLHCFLEASRRWVGCKSASCDVARQHCGGFQCERALVKQADPWGPTKQVGIVLSFWSSFTTFLARRVNGEETNFFVLLQNSI